MEQPRRGIPIKQLSPKAKIALRAIALGAMKHREAAQIAGVHPAYVSQLKNSEPGKNYMQQLDAKFEDSTIETSQLMTELGRKAVQKLAHLMEWSGQEAIQLRAAIDLADRSPETQKVQKHQVESFSLSGKDAKEIAAAMVQAAAVRQRFTAVENGDYIKIPLEGTNERDRAVLGESTEGVRRDDLPDIP